MEYPIRKDEAKAYLETKYQESFDVYSTTSVGIDQPYAELFFRPASRPELMVKVYDDHREFADDYYGLRIREPLQALMDEAAASVPAELKICFRFQARTFRNELTDPASFPEALAANPDDFSANIFVFADAAQAPDDAAWEAFLSALRERNITGTVMLFLVRGDDLAGISDATWNDFLSAHIELRSVRTAYIR